MKTQVQTRFAVIWRCLLCGVVLLGFLCLFSVDVFAQEAASSDQESEELIKLKRRLPVLNGHNFVPSSNITQVPFITTHFRNTTGAGSALGKKVPIYDENGDILLELNAKIIYMLLDLSYQQAVTDWLAFWIEAFGAGRTGTNAESILSQGVSSLGALEIGSLARIWGNDKALLSGAISLRHNKLIGVDIIGFALNAIDTGIIDTDLLYNRIPSYRIKGGLRFAYAFNDLWGLQAFVDYGRGDSLTGEDKKDTVFEFGALASLDLNTRTILPIGFALGYRGTSYPEASGDLVERADLTSLRIAYTGRREFSLGLEWGYTSSTIINTDKKLKLGSIAFNIQYFF